MSFDFSNEKPQAATLFSLEPMAQKIEIRLKNLLAPPPPGIYLAGQIEPVLVPGQPYFIREKGVLVPLADLKDASSAIYDKNGKKLIGSTFVKNKEAFLSNAPIEPIAV